MAVKSVIDIDVNDASFHRFQALFSKYQDALAKTPSAWREVGKVTSEAGSHFERATAALLAQAQQARALEAASEKEEKHLTQSDRLWTSMAHSTKSVAGNIISATTALVRWTGVLSAVGGLLGAGGLFGIDRMAAGVANQRRSSMGLGMSVGEHQAFDLNFRRLIDPGSFLENINDMRADPSKAWPLAVLGVSSAGSTETVAINALKALRARTLATADNQIGLIPQQTGFDIDVDSLRRLHDMSGAEFDKLLEKNRKDIGRFNTSGSTNEGWQDVSDQLSRAGTAIFDAFQARVGQLAPELTKLSEGLTNLATTVINSDLVKGGIEKLGTGLDWLAQKIGSSEFQQKIDSLLSESGPVATALGKFSKSVQEFAVEAEADLPVISKWMHALAHPLESDTPWASAVGGAAHDAMHPYENPKEVERREGMIHERSTIEGAKQFGTDSRKFRQDPNKGNFLRALADLDKKYGLPDGSAEYVWLRESGSTFNPPDNPQSGAVGAFQVIPKWGAKYGATPEDLRDPLKGADVGMRMLSDDFKHYGGDDIKKALAAYDLGSGKLDPIVKEHPTDWDRYVPDETRNYVRKAPAGLTAQAPGVTVNINNNTGGSATVAASQLPY